MGPSGSGKSTLAKLLQGFYLPASGEIRIDGQDIRHLSANELRQTFGVVPQETTLFATALYENLLMVSLAATFEDIVRVCRQAEIHDVIERLPDGYQTEIGERGVGLSTGQKQRIAIARALLKNPKVLIFDEATSSLDQATAESLCQTILRRSWLGSGDSCGPRAAAWAATVLFLVGMSMIFPHVMPRTQNPG